MAAGDIFNNIKGIIGNLFQFGKGSGSIIQDNSTVIEMKNAANNAFVTGRALPIQASNTVNDLATWIDIVGKVIQFSFEGGSPPSPGANTGKFGFCHTAGGSYSAADVVYDNGSALVKQVRDACRILVTSSAVTGTISLNANGIYAWETSAYVLKGDGNSGGTGNLKSIQLSITKDSGNVDSTAALASGDIVLGVLANITQTFNGTTPTLAVTVNGSSPLALMATTENNLKAINQYEVGTLQQVGATNAGVIRAAVTPDSSTTGAGKVVVLYSTPNA